MASPFARLAFWYSALGGSAACPEYPFGPPEPTDASLRRFAERLREAPPATRAALASVLRGQAAVLPWSAIHPSWLEPVLAEYPPQWRLWALALLPSGMRSRLEEDRGEGPSALLAGRAPAWWPAFFTADVRRRLAYPDLAPIPEATAGLPGVLWERPDSELAGALAVHGTRGVVSAARQLPRAEAQSLLWQLPAPCQAVAQEAVARRLFSDDPFWPEMLERLAPEFPELEARLFRMGLADWLRVGLQRGQAGTLNRLAFRLPRRWGEWMRRVLDERPDWLSRPPREGAAAWDAGLTQLLGAPDERALVGEA
jgi:hypothetical protein